MRPMNRLRFGTYLARNMLPVYQAITEKLGRRLGIEAELVVETDCESCAKDKNEVCFVCSLPCVEFERQGISPAVPSAAPVLAGERYAGRPIYFSDVIVHRRSPFLSFLDLRGRSRANLEPGSIRMVSPGLALWQAGIEIVPPDAATPLKGHVVQVMKKAQDRRLILEEHPKVFPSPPA
jgi:hypothetical protein